MPDLPVRDGQALVSYDRRPDVCPICHHALEPIFVATHVTKWPADMASFLEIVFRCPRELCSRLFIARYRCSTVPANMKALKPSFNFQHAVPFTVKPPNFPQEIKNLSPLFVEIFGQAAAAEQYGLKQVAGVGYRKALEFLIKDFCISKHPDRAEEIKAAWLGPCIKTYVGDANIELCAERAVWLGNDETHYVRRWEDKDITDLKNLIDLTLAWIQHNLLTEKYLSDMPK